jgi:SAM-dependent methyltransferase
MYETRLASRDAATRFAAMPPLEMPPLQKLAGAEAHFDVPQPGATAYGEALSVSGWCHLPGRDPAECRVRAWVDRALIGETRALFVRPDVCAVFHLPANTPSGFRLLGRMADVRMQRDAVITLTASWEDEGIEFEIGSSPIRLVPALLEARPYGDVVNPERETLLHRENIYGSGPPIEEPGGPMLELIRQYLPRAGSVVDVGCGAGAYGPALIEDGHEWLGLETNARCCEILERRHLPYRRTPGEGSAFPTATAEFDDAIGIEVLEHIANVDAFLAEIARTIRRRALFSVPNLEVLPYFSAWQVVPWHLLEADHKNFFTRASLRAVLSRHFRDVEVFSYAEHALRSREDLPLHVHLFAIADK